MSTPDKETTRFFLALKKALKELKILDHMQTIIYNQVETNYIHISDDEIKKYLREKK